MKPIDISYQKAVDNEADKILYLSVKEFLKFDDYGALETLVDDKKITIGFWHYRPSDDLHHIVFQAQRRVFLFFFKKYLSGVKLENGALKKLNDREIGDYD